MIQAHEPDDLTPQQLCELKATLLSQLSELDGTVARQRQDILVRQTRIDQLTHELAVLKRWKVGRRSEQLDASQASLLDEDVAGDLAAI